MKNIFKVTIKLPNDEQEVFFDDQNRAEKFINAMRQIMTDKGNKEVEFVPELIDNIEIDGIDTKDYPDFCDAFIASADYDGKEMTEEQLDKLNEDSDFVYECVQNHLF